MVPGSRATALLSARPTAAMAMYEPPHAVFAPVDVRDAEIVSHNGTSVESPVGEATE